MESIVYILLIARFSLGFLFVVVLRRCLLLGHFSKSSNHCSSNTLQCCLFSISKASHAGPSVAFRAHHFYSMSEQRIELAAEAWEVVPNMKPCSLCWDMTDPRTEAPPARKTHYHCLADGCKYWCVSKQRALAHTASKHGAAGSPVCSPRAWERTWLPCAELTVPSTS